MLLDILFLDVTVFLKGFGDFSIEFFQKIRSLVKCKDSKKRQLFRALIFHFLINTESNPIQYLKFELLLNVIEFN